LNIYNNLKKFTNNLPKETRTGVNDVIKWVLSGATIIVVLLILWHSATAKHARRGGSISGQAMAENMSEFITNYLAAIAMSILILVVAAMVVL
jgi:hypothetical protein